MDSCVIKKQLFQIQRTIAFWKRILWIYFAENINKFEMWPLVIFNIIPKLPLFLFWNPNFTNITIKKYHHVGEEFLYTLYAPSSSIARSPKEESHHAGISGSYFFPFLQLLTNQTNCKILNQMCNFQFQHKPINPLLLQASSSTTWFFFCRCGFFFSHFFCV